MQLNLKQLSATNKTVFRPVTNTSYAVLSDEALKMMREEHEAKMKLIGMKTANVVLKEMRMKLQIQVLSTHLSTQQIVVMNEPNMFNWSSMSTQQ